MQTTQNQLSRYRAASLVILSMLLFIMAPTANAITKYLSMVDGNGQQLVNTIITITYPDGSTKTEKTDDQGILEYDFNETGKYTLSDPAGNMIKTVSIAGSGMNTKTITIAAIAAGAAIVLIAAGSSGDSDSGSDQPGTPSEPDGPGDGDGIEEGAIGGTYNISATLANNPGDLPVLLSNLVLRFEVIGTQLTINQVSSNPDFPAQLSGTIAGESFSANANGNYGGTQTSFLLAGSIPSSQTVTFLINVGSDGSLEGGQAITYNATGTRQ